MTGRLASDELNIDVVNAALSQVKGLGFPVSEMPSVGGQRPNMSPQNLQVEDTNEMVRRISGGMLDEQLDPSVGIKDKAPSKAPKASPKGNVFEQIRNKHINALAEADNYQEFRSALGSMMADVREYKADHVTEAKGAKGKKITFSPKIYREMGVGNNDCDGISNKAIKAIESYASKELIGIDSGEDAEVFHKSETKAIKDFIEGDF